MGHQRAVLPMMLLWNWMRQRCSYSAFLLKCSRKVVPFLALFCQFYSEVCSQIFDRNYWMWIIRVETCFLFVFANHSLKWSAFLLLFSLNSLFFISSFQQLQWNLLLVVKLPQVLFWRQLPFNLLFFMYILCPYLFVAGVFVSMNPCLNLNKPLISIDAHNIPVYPIDTHSDDVGHWGMVLAHFQRGHRIWSRHPHFFWHIIFALSWGPYLRAEHLGNEAGALFWGLR